MITSKPADSKASYPPNGGNDLKIWNCTSCRRRKVRCDRRYPCVQCTRIKVECVFPVSGRIPRRARDTNQPNGSGQKRVELVKRLRRLEAMVGDLGSQVENASEVRGGVLSKVYSNDAIDAGDVANVTPGDSNWIEYRPALQNVSSGSTPSTTIARERSNSMSSHSVMTSQPGSVESGPSSIADDGDLVIGDQFWTVFCKEVEHIFEAVHGAEASQRFHEQDTSAKPSVPSNTESRSGYYGFLLRSASSGLQQKEDSHPPPVQMLFLWHVYMDNIDPFMKVLHIPTMTKIVQGLRSNHHAISPSMRALLLAISFAAVMSLEDKEISMNFDTEKNQALTRYRASTERAFAQTDVLDKPDITVLQAMTIYLSVLQNIGEMKSAWYFTGTLIRIAVSMDMHCDSSRFATISPFETEMRRRIWWQICLIDARSEGGAQLSAFKISEGMFDTQMPTCMNDAEISPETLETPVPIEAWTDMTTSLVRCEVWKLSRRLQSVILTKSISPTSSSNMKEALDLFQVTQTCIETTYLKHVDPNQPLHAFITASTRLYLTRVGLLLRTSSFTASDSRGNHYPPTPKKLIHQGSERAHDEHFVSCLSIIEYTHALQKEPSWRGWAWQLQGHPQQPPWQALRIVLVHLDRRRYWSEICERALTSVKAYLDSIPDSGRSDSRYQQLSALWSKIEARRKNHVLGNYLSRPSQQQQQGIFNEFTSLRLTGVNLSPTHPSQHSTLRTIPADTVNNETTNFTPTTWVAMPPTSQEPCFGMVEEDPFPAEAQDWTLDGDHHTRFVDESPFSNLFEMDWQALAASLWDDATIGGSGEQTTLGNEPWSLDFWGSSVLREVR